jgi:electron transfer flavoprotein alpha/beta subunit
MEDAIEEGVRLVGVATLKVLTLGRYRADAASRLAEGAIGLGVIAVFMWLGYYWLA